MKKSKLNKWTFIFEIIRDWATPTGYIFRFGIFKMKYYLEHGEAISRDCYKGFFKAIPLRRNKLRYK